MFRFVENLVSSSTLYNSLVLETPLQFFSFFIEEFIVHVRLKQDELFCGFYLF